jgi:hypothetical protein
MVVSSLCGIDGFEEFFVQFGFFDQSYLGDGSLKYLSAAAGSSLARPRSFNTHSLSFSSNAVEGWMTRESSFFQTDPFRPGGFIKIFYQ